MTLQDRFWAKVERLGDGPYDCWEWKAAGCPNGYGQIKVDGRLVMAHRVAYEMSVGPIPVGKELDHLCRNRRCVRVLHLEAVSRAQNVRRGSGSGAVNFRRDRCVNGHEFTPENTLHPYRANREWRRCRACKAARDVRYRRGTDDQEA